MSEDIKIDEQEQNTENTRLVRCPCCGKFTLEKPIKLNSVLIDQWIACLLAAVPFSHTYPIYDGKVYITVTQLSTQVEDDLSSFRALLDSLDGLPWDKDGNPSCPINIDHLKSAIHTYSSLVSIEINSNGESKLYKPSEVVWAAYERFKELRPKILDGTLLNSDQEAALSTIKDGYNTMFNQANISSLPLAMILAIVETHNRLVLTLMDNGFDSNFWKGIELG